VARLLLARAPALLGMRDGAGNTALAMAAACASAQTLQLLLEHEGADVLGDRIDGGDGELGADATILHVLADGGDAACVGALLAALSDDDAARLAATPTAHGAHAAAIAAFAGHAEVARMLLRVRGVASPGRVCH
jgi:hypothetical protein